MDTIECGSASGVLRLGNGGARGLLYRNDQAAICCDPVSMTASYPHLAPALRALPGAFVVNAGQAELHRHVVKRTGATGLLRQACFSESEAREWLDRSIQRLADNRAWWSSRS